MLEKHIQTTKTARYFQIGEITPQTKIIVIACHGYAQLAKYFLQWMKDIDTSECVIIAPEGLHRFYWEGFSGRVVASWMTKEDRENDIKDYCLFLDNVVNSIQIPPKAKLVGLGFSQGAATISRWAAHTNHSLSNLVLWAGVFPEDIAVDQINFKLDTPIEILFGDNDKFFNMSSIEEVRKRMEELEINYTFTQFEGEHKIYTEPFDKLIKKIGNT